MIVLGFEGPEFNVSCVLLKLRRDFDRPNAFAVRFTFVHFGRMRGQNHYVSLRFNMGYVDIKKI